MTEPPGRQASTSRAPAMCKPGHSPASAPDPQDSQSDPDLAVPSRMYGHLVVDIVTLGLIVLAALLSLACRLWQKRKAAKAARRLEKGRFDFNDFLEQMKMLQNLGPLEGLLGMMPGFNKIKKQLPSGPLDSKRIKQHVHHRFDERP